VLVFAIAFCGGDAPSALADPIFSIINLGPASNGTTDVKVATDASGNQIVVDASGQTAYPFPASPNLLSGMSQTDLQRLTASVVNSSWIPVNVDATPDNGYQFDHFRPEFLNSNGVLVGVENAGVNGHYDNFSTNYAIRQSDGSFLPLQGIPNSKFGFGSDSTGTPSYGQGQILNGLNNLNRVLGWDANGPYLYDINTKTLTYFNGISLDGHILPTVSSNALIPVSNGPYWNLDNGLDYAWLKKKDAQGRILADAFLAQPKDPNNPIYGYNVLGEYMILLSPQGVQTNPVPIPEPGSIVVFVLLAAGYGVHRVRSRKLSA
jgi:hypothetical protein